MELNITAEKKWYTHKNKKYYNIYIYIIMELLLLGTLGGVGYLLNNKPTKEKLTVNDKPNGKNIYDSNDILNNRKIEQIRSNKMYNKIGSNVLIPGPPKPMFNKIDYKNNNLPVVFNDPSNQQQIKTSNELNPNYFVETEGEGGGFNGIDLIGNQVQSLSGELLDRQNFVHNNMVPFFGGTVKQNVEDNANRTRMENFTGASANYKEKTEIKPMFDPEANITNVYGSQNMDQYNRDRYITSNIQNNVQPFEKVYVGPGLNKGYTSKPSGGFQQANTRDYSLPKTTNQLRVKTNPKVSYYGRVVSGKHIARPSKIGIVAKNRPDRFYVNSKNRWFTTVGAQTGAKQRPKIVLKFSNRKTTGTKMRLNPAGPTDNGKEGKRGKIRVSKKIQLGNGGLRNVENLNKWHEMNFDYGKKNILLVKSKKQDTQCNMRQMGNVQMPEGSMINLGNINPTLRNTRRNNVTGNPNWTSNMQSNYKPGIAYDPNDVLKTTVKEQTINNDHLGVASDLNSGKYTKTIDSAKITIKQQTENDNHMGTASSKSGLGGYQTNPKKASNTHRQDTSTEYFGDSQGNQVGGYKIKNINLPNTSRQFTSNNSYTGVAGSSDKTPESRMKYKNAKTKSSRQIVSKGRAPGPSGSKKFVSKKDINATTKKDSTLTNKRVNKRGVISTKIYNSIPQVNKSSITKQKMKVSNKVLDNRLDPTLLEPFKKNPYTQSLKSYAYN